MESFDVSAVVVLTHPVRTMAVTLNTSGAISSPAICLCLPYITVPCGNKELKPHPRGINGASSFVLSVGRTAEHSNMPDRVCFRGSTAGVHSFAKDSLDHEPSTFQSTKGSSTHPLACIVATKCFRTSSSSAWVIMVAAKSFGGIKKSSIFQNALSISIVLHELWSRLFGEQLDITGSLGCYELWVLSTVASTSVKLWRLYLVPSFSTLLEPYCIASVFTSWCPKDLHTERSIRAMISRRHQSWVAVSFRLDGIWEGARLRNPSHHCPFSPVARNPSYCPSSPLRLFSPPPRQGGLPNEASMRDGWPVRIRPTSPRRSRSYRTRHPLVSRTICCRIINGNLKTARCKYEQNEAKENELNPLLPADALSPHRYTQCDENTARQLRALRLVAMAHLLREAGGRGTVAERLVCSPPTKAIVPDDAVGRSFFLGDIPFPPPFHSGAAPYSSFITLIGCQDLDRSLPYGTCKIAGTYVRECCADSSVQVYASTPAQMLRDTRNLAKNYTLPSPPSLWSDHLQESEVHQPLFNRVRRLLDLERKMEFLCVTRRVLAKWESCKSHIHLTCELVCAGGPRKITVNRSRLLRVSGGVVTRNSARRNKDSVRDRNRALERESECPLHSTLHFKSDTLYRYRRPGSTSSELQDATWFDLVPLGVVCRGRMEEFLHALGREHAAPFSLAPCRARPVPVCAAHCLSMYHQKWTGRARPMELAESFSLSDDPRRDEAIKMQLDVPFVASCINTQHMAAISLRNQRPIRRFASCLDKKNIPVRYLCEAIGQYASCRPRSDDHEVVLSIIQQSGGAFLHTVRISARSGASPLCRSARPVGFGDRPCRNRMTSPRRNVVGTCQEFHAWSAQLCVKMYDEEDVILVEAAVIVIAGVIKRPRKFWIHPSLKSGNTYSGSDLIKDLLLYGVDS
ncbi:hypothetical protein PR048_026335 [Dryococelus australis]|uniref:Uncharacterized protein n=1 Tax=Dryococelus australis TaxID=614101 RepID=A0ABQ9GL12_9NEOP|nr:hypothetical protein PR048_026335 [Dryococelus australis]